MGGRAAGAARRELGQRGEAVAAAHLRRSGMQVVARNWRCRQGELDVVALEGDQLVVVEVKARRSLGQGHPAEAVTPVKAARLRRLSAAFLAAHPALAGVGAVRVGAVRVGAVRVGAVRVDVVAVVFRRGLPALLQHLRAVA